MVLANADLLHSKATAVNATPVSPQKAVPQATESTEPCHNFCLLFLFCVVKASSHIDADLGWYLFGRELRAWDQLNILRVWKTCYFHSLHVVICFWLPAWRHSCNFSLHQMTTWLEVQNQTPAVALNTTPQAAQVSCLQVLMYLVSDANGQISRRRGELCFVATHSRHLSKDLITIRVCCSLLMLAYACSCHVCNQRCCACLALACACPSADI